MTSESAGLVVVAGLLLSGCAAGSSTATSSTTSASGAEAGLGGPGGGQGGPGGGGNAQCATSTAAVPAVDATSYAADSSNSEVVALAKAFAATLTADQTSSVQLGYSLADAEK